MLDVEKKAVNSGARAKVRLIGFIVCVGGLDLFCEFGKMVFNLQQLFAGVCFAALRQIFALHFLLPGLSREGTKRNIPQGILLQVRSRMQVEVFGLLIKPDHIP